MSDPNLSAGFDGQDEAALDPELLQTEERDRRYDERASRPDYHHKLTRVGKAYLEASAPVVGALVQWKPSMRNAPFPHYGRPMFVLGEATTDMLPSNTLFTSGPDEFLSTLLAGFLDADNDLAIIRVDPRRVMPWTAPDEFD